MSMDGANLFNLINVVLDYFGDNFGFGFCMITAL